MPNLKDIKTRINSVQNTSKITNAMKLVSAAKFARASHAVAASRPYSRGLERVKSAMLAGTSVNLNSPFLISREERKCLIVLVATDRGLCGGLNNNLFKNAASLIAEKRSKNIDVQCVAWGRRAISFAKSAGLEMVEHRENVLDKPTYGMAKAASRELCQGFVESKFDLVYLMYSEFKSALSQEPKRLQLLPIPVLEMTDGDRNKADYIVEPDVMTVYNDLLQRSLAVAVFQALLEARASEHGARMTAMDSATSNAKEVNRKLTLQYNRARQAAITTELVEITAGAEAL